MEKSSKKTKTIKEKISTTPLTDECILKEQQKYMLETYLKPLLFPPKVELNEGTSITSQEHERNRSFEIEDCTSSSAQQKCVNYANCKKKFPSACCRRCFKVICSHQLPVLHSNTVIVFIYDYRMCFACCRADSPNNTCTFHHNQQQKKDGE